MQSRIRESFQQTVFEYYVHHGRHDLPWRLPEPKGGFDPYKILVSELMLQQTQVARVIPKYEHFLELFPTSSRLAAAPLGAVLQAWSGLGYNRRAKFLWQSAAAIEHNFQGVFPSNQTDLTALPGVGVNTAGAIATYALNQPVVFIETNIRTVFIHHFFADEEGIADTAILKLVAATLDTEHPREWYWALMDYGVHLKQTVGNLNRAGKSYAKQSTFHGSRRQIRGQVVRLLASGPLATDQLSKLIDDERLPAVLADLTREQLIQRRRDRFRL